MNQHLTRPSRALAATLAAVLLVVASACTSDSDEPTAQGSASPLPDRSVGSAPTLDAKPVPLEVTVDRVVGDRLGKDKRQRLARQVGAALEGYAEHAALAGGYGRDDLRRALGAFTAGAARLAVADRDVLTSAATASRTEEVVPLLKRVRLDVLSPPGRTVAGVTAHLKLVYRQQQTRGGDQRVTVQGRLMLTRNNAGTWKVFGYDVARTSVPAGKGGR